MSAKTVDISGLKIGGHNPVRVESMLKTALCDVDACFEETEKLRAAGCELARVAFPDMSVAENFKALVLRSKLRLMADIHFNHKFALFALDAGCPAIRINPGNISDPKAVPEIVAAARTNGAVIRIGANGGSLNDGQMAEANGDRSVALANAVEEQLKLLVEQNFDNIIISAKSSNVQENLRANSILSQRWQFPMHIGITEAGSGVSGIVKGAAGIGAMLLQGIGDTIRVSLTADPVEEIKTGYAILNALGIRQRGYNLVSCPTCGRRRIDVQKLAAQVETMLPDDLPNGITIAVMGCEVNGPREAANADIGVAGTPSGFVMFTHGKHFCNATVEEFENKFKQLLNTVQGELK